MLTEEDAIIIVVDCIRAVSHVAEVDLNGTLDDNEIFDADRVNAFVTLVVHDKKIGVLSKLHRSSSEFFRKTGPSSTVNSCIKIVRDKSVEVRSNALEDFASMVATHISLQTQKKPRANAIPRKAAASPKKKKEDSK